MAAFDVAAKNEHQKALYIGYVTSAVIRSYFNLLMHYFKEILCTTTFMHQYVLL